MQATVSHSGSELGYGIRRAAHKRKETFWVFAMITSFAGSFVFLLGGLLVSLLAIVEHLESEPAYGHITVASLILSFALGVLGGHSMDRLADLRKNKEF